MVRGRSISDIAALVRRADLVICNDTGVMHVAVAAGARVLAIFGPTDPRRWAPVSEALVVVRAPGGNLAGLSAETVVETALALLALAATPVDQ